VIAAVVTGIVVVADVDVGAPVVVASADSVNVAVVGTRVDDEVVVTVEESATVVQPGPKQLWTSISAQFQNFSAPLLLVRGSTTSVGHDASNGFHHALASPPNLEAIHDCVALLSKYSASPAGLQEFAVTQKN